MKTPDEIKKGLEVCSTKKPCASCPMWEECKEASSLKPLWDNALAYIQQLEDANDQLFAANERLKEKNEAFMQSAIGCCYESRCNAQIKELEALCKRLMDEKEQLERERDAAVADLKAMADKVRDVYGDETPCFCCKHDKDIYVTESGAWSAECPGFSADDCFDWRGVKEE